MAEFITQPAPIDEEALTDPDPWITAARLAREKALWLHEQLPNHLVIGGDTVVAIQEENGWIQLAKPADPQDACRMLALLSGREHVVITGVAVRSPKGLAVSTETTKVTFRVLSSEEIERYVATSEPMDKAGAYGIQGGAKAFLDRMEGPLDNVIGLPRELLSGMLKDLG